MRNRRSVGNLRDTNTGGLDGADRALAAGTGALHTNFALVHALGNRDARRILSDHRRRERGGLAGTLEARLAGRAPADHAATGVRNRDLRVVERRTNECDSGRNRLAALLGLDGLAFGSTLRRSGGRSLGGDLFLDFPIF